MLLVARDYGGAAMHLAQAEQRGFDGVQVLLVYSLCLAGRIDTAQELAHHADTGILTQVISGAG